MNYFAIAKNSKRAIFIINIGIFLSIFALTAASISIYIENKVSNLEFEHLENSRAKSLSEKYTKMVIDYKNKLRQYKNMEGSFEQNLEFLRLNLMYSHKCQTRKLFSTGFKVGTPEYKKCILNKGKKIND